MCRKYPHLQTREKGGMLRIGDIKGTVRTGDRVYKITDAALMQSLRRSYEEAGPEGTKSQKDSACLYEFAGSDRADRRFLRSEAVSGV